VNQSTAVPSNSSQQSNQALERISNQISSSYKTIASCFLVVIVLVAWLFLLLGMLFALGFEPPPLRSCPALQLFDLAKMMIKSRQNSEYCKLRLEIRMTTHYALNRLSMWASLSITTSLSLSLAGFCVGDRTDQLCVC
jgi:uncharacterized RDD family membrane protein YckC